MNPTKLALLRVKYFVARHKVAVAVLGTATSCLYLNRVVIKQHDEFLKEKGLYNEFYYPELDD